MGTRRRNPLGRDRREIHCRRRRRRLLVVISWAIISVLHWYLNSQ